MKNVEFSRSTSDVGNESADNSEVVFFSYVRNEGRITVPKELRDACDIAEGDLIECKIRKIK